MDCLSNSFIKTVKIVICYTFNAKKSFILKKDGFLCKNKNYLNL